MGAPSILRSIFSVYSKSLKSRPIATQIASSALLWGAGDYLAQKIEKHPFQARRCAMMSSYGGLFNGVVGHAWYIALDKGMKRVAVPGTAAFVGGKVLADTVIFGPFHVAAFFTIITLVEGGTLKDVKRKIDTDLVPALAAEVAIWPIIQAVNFWKVPVEYQLLVVNGFTVIDAAFMSWVQHNSFREKIEAYLKKKKLVADSAL
ncbi:hypothetical protein Ndes2526B_g02941 [Nannochloris sp. 'desiccata']